MQYEYVLFIIASVNMRDDHAYMVCVILQSACSHKGNHEISECFVVKQLSIEEADV